MNEDIKNPVDEESNSRETSTNDRFEEAIRNQLKKIQTQNLLLGAQTICHVILDKIYAFESSNGKKSTNDYKRCLKDLKRFCETGVSRKVNTNGETEPIKEDSEDSKNNTKLMEEVNESNANKSD